MKSIYTSVEICAGAGGQALGLEQAGFSHLACVEFDDSAVETLRANRAEEWNVVKMDVREWHLGSKSSIDLLAGGIPCPPYSIAGRQLGSSDERDLFPEVIRLTREIMPRAILIENVRGLLGKKFDSYRSRILRELKSLGYVGKWQLLNASDFGVPQLRPRAILIALKQSDLEYFQWPSPIQVAAPTVGEALLESMSANGWTNAGKWANGASAVAPTIVGGSKKHGGADLGPTRAKKAWAQLGVNAISLADDVPSRDYVGQPRLTIRQAAIIQGFPIDWIISGRKTAAYRQVGNAFPPPVARAIGIQILEAFRASDESMSAAEGAAVA